MATFEALTGNPVVVADHARSYLLTADAINDAAASLLRISGQQDAIGQAFDAVRNLTNEVSRSISQAEGRYRATAQALAGYATDLEAAQQRAARAAQTAGDAQGNAAGLASRVAALEDTARIPGPEQLAEQQKLTSAQSRLDAAQGDEAAASADYNGAVADKNDAATRAAGLIEAVVADSPLNDGFWDDVGGFVDGISDWMGDVLGTIIDFVAAVVDVIARLLIAVLIIAALAALVLLVLAALGAAFAALVVVIVIAALAAAALVVLALVAMAKENGRPTVTQTQRGTPDSPTDDPYATLFLEQRRIDGAGKDLDGDGSPDEAVVSVTKVVGADGVTRWRVQIPSTQVWSPFETRAPNDLNSDLVAKLNPAQRTQLEKAVQSALEQSEDYTAGDPVMLSGFSLGGITAGNLAADSDFARKFNVQAVVTAGSPLDDIDIPSNVSVLSLEHNTDPVANGGDLLAPHQTEANRIVIDADAPTAIPSSWGSPGKPTALAPVGHGSLDYAVTAGTRITQSADPAVREFREQNAEFFGPNQTYYDFSVTRG